MKIILSLILSLLLSSCATVGYRPNYILTQGAEEKEKQSISSKNDIPSKESIAD